MINITNENNSVVFYIDDEQVLSFPMNELSVLTEEVSDIVMFKTAKNFKTVVQERWEEITINGEPITKENVVDKFNEIANTNEGGAKINAGTNITLQEEADGSITISATGELGGTVAWADVTDKPSTFTPSAHNHVVADITDLQGKLDEKANVSDIPSLDGYATEEWVNSQGYLTEHQDISQLATKSELATKQDTLVSGTNIKTINGQDILGEGNIEIQGDTGGIADAPSDGKKYVRQNANWVEETTVDTSNFATKAELDGKVDDAEIADMLTKTEAASTYQPKGEYLTSIPDEYVTETELSEKGYLTEIPSEYVTDEELNSKGYATTTQLDSKLDTETYNSDKATFATKEELADKANTSDLSNYLQTSVAESTYAKKSEIPEEYTLPIATAEALGGIKVGAGLSINPETGVLSATGGGTADSVDWANITSKPETFKPEAHQHVTADVTDLQDKLDAKADTTAIADMATKTWVGEQGYLTEHQDISTLATKQEVTEGLATKQDKGDYALKSELTNLATKDELNLKANSSDLSNYVTTVNAEATYAKKSEIPSLEGYLQTSTADEKYATKTELSGKADTSAIADMLTKTEASSTYQPKGEYLTEIPSEYITESELNAKEYKKIVYLTQTQYDELPTKEEGVMYVITDAPEVVVPDTSTFATKEEIADMATKTWVGEQGFLTSHQDISQLATKQEVTEGLATKQDTLVSGTNIKTVNGNSLLGEGNIEIQGGNTEPKVWNTLNNEDFYNNAKVGDFISLSVPLTKLIIQDIRNGNGDQGTSGRNKTYTCSYYIDSYTKGREKVSVYQFIVLESDYSVTTVEIKLATQNDLSTKQNTLVSGESIKTINGQDILGEGNIEIQGGTGDVTKQYVDEQLTLKADKTEIADMLTKTEASTTYALQTALQAALDRIAALETQVGNISTQLDNINGEIV